MKTNQTGISVESFLGSISDERRKEATALIALMQEISGEKPYMWGPSIIGFGTQHYKYDTGREGDIPRLAFSPRKASITIYFNEGFNRYAEELAAIGKHKQSVSCLYINKLSDISLGVLHKMLEQSYGINSNSVNKPSTVKEYVESVPSFARPKFDELRQIVQKTIPEANEVLSYGIIGYKIDDKRAKVFISGWKDHLAIYPVPKDEKLKSDLVPYIKGKGTLWLGLEDPLPKMLIKAVVKSLVRN